MPVIDTARTRLLLVLLLLAGHATLFPLYAEQPVDQSAWVLPGADDFVTSPNRYLGDRVVAGGIVQERSPLVIKVRTPDGRHRVTVTDSGFTPAPGDKIRVYGVLTAPCSIRALYAFKVPRGGLWYTWTVSFLAGLWVLSRLVRHWRVDLTSLSFHPREQPLSFQMAVRRIRHRGGERDA